MQQEHVTEPPLQSAPSSVKGNRHTAAGMDPVNRFPSKCNTDIPDTDPSDVGMVPVNLFWYNHRLVKRERLPKVVGSLPVKPQNVNDREVNVSTPPIPSGIGELKRV